MSSIKVAVRVRPLNKREQDLGSKCIIEMNGKKTTITNTKKKSVNLSSDQQTVSREVDKLCGEIGMEGNKGREVRKEFVFDHSYWSADSKDAHFVTQEKVFKDLGSEVLQNAYDGYNACLFAYGQTSAGKTYTMMGAADQLGLIPRICKGLFSYISRNSSNGGSFRTEVSYSEIYNEHVRDLLRPTNVKKMPQQNLKVREHPKEGPYVEGLTKQHVSDFESIEALVEQGNNLRATASTRMNDHSSRSHAIFTIRFTQAKFVSDMPSETISKIHLVDLAGSERASASGASGERLKEGGNINKSLVTLGIVISTLADNSLMANQEGSGRKLTFRRKLFVPYRDSVLTFLLKDSLGGNSKTIMIAAISPAECNYGESLSTLRYANRAKNIINKPTVNEDPNVKIIRDLRQEIERLRTIIRRSNLGPQNALDDDVTEVTQKLEENQAKVEKLTKDWTEKWKEAREIMQESELALRRQGSCVVLVDLELPHLVRLEEDPLRTEIMLYRLMHGKTRIGREDAPNPQDIVLEGEGVAKEHCVIEYTKKDVFVEPLSSMCWVNGVIVSQATKLIQGDVLVLGKNEVFKFNFPVEAAKLREKRRSFHLKKGESTESLSSFYSNFRGSVSDLALRGSHGDLSFRSESPTQITIDSGVEEDLGEGVASDRANIDELKIQLSDLIAKHKESEARRVEVEKSYQEEIMCKWKEIEEQKDIIQTLREQQDSKADEAQIELDKMRTIFDEQSIKDRKSLEEQINLLVELKHKDRHLEENDKNEVTADEKTSIVSYLEEHWSTIEQSELKLAEIQLQMNKAIEQSEIDLLKHTERMNWEKQEELNEIDLERKTLEELNTKLSESFATSETNLKEKKVYLENNIETGYQQLNDVENVIKLLEEQQQHFFEKLEIDPKEVKRKLLEEQRTGKHKLDEVREKVLVFEKEIQNGLDGAEKSNLEQRYLDLESELQNLCCFKKEKQETVDGSKKELSGLISKVEKSRKELLSNEEQLLRVRQRYFACEKKHDEDLETNLDILKNERNAKMDELMNERERCVVLLQNEYQRMEDAVSNACDITSVEQELSVKKVLEAQKCVVMSLIKDKRDQVETGGTANVLDYLTRRAKFEREQERMIEQQKKVSEHILADIREKELTVKKLTSQRDQFHFEREKERLAIRKRIQRIERAKSVDDIQSEYTLEFYKEESKKLREAFERVTEAETRLTSEVREKEAVLLQLEATRAKLLDVEEDHEDSENRVKELEALRQQKDAQIAELRKHIEDEKRKYLEHLKSEDYEIIEKPLVNRLHVKYRVLGNHAAAEVLKEALLAANVTEMKKQIPWYNTTSSENTGGWIFQGSQKNVAILRKREETASGFIHCFLGRGIIEVDAQTVWEAVRNPLSRYIYDNMLKKINIVEHVEEGLKVVYMLHETSQCFMTHSRDFCFVTKERVEKEKFVQASQSIDHQRCPHVSGIIRGQILSSGWLVERCNVDGKNASVVWYITKVHLGDTTLPWRLIDLLSKRQPLSIAYLNSYLTPS